MMTVKQLEAAKLYNALDGVKQVSPELFQILSKCHLKIDRDSTISRMTIRQRNQVNELVINEDYLENNNVAVVASGLLHEALHVQLKHGELFDTLSHLYSDENLMSLFNIAADLEVNQHVGLLLPPGKEMPHDFVLPGMHCGEYDLTQMVWGQGTMYYLNELILQWLEKHGEFDTIKTEEEERNANIPDAPRRV
jgi:predicted metal-dependent peptidase